MSLDELEQLRLENKSLRGRLAHLIHTRFDEQRYRDLVSATSEGIWVYDTANATTFVNPRMAEMLGYAADEMVGQPLLAFVDPSQHAAARARLDRRRKGVVERTDVVLRRKDGSELHVSVQGHPLFGADGAFLGGLLLSTDITLQHRAEQARARLAAIVESSEDAIISVDLEEVIMSWNRGAEKLFGYRADEVIGKPTGVLAPIDVGEDAPVVRALGSGDDVLRHEGRVKRRDGSEAIVAVTVSPLRDASGQLIGRATIARDVTSERRTEAALRRTEQQLRQAQKMDAVGRLAGGVAHDFNNLLSVILCYASAGREELPVGDPLREDLDEIERAGERGTELTRQLLAFSRQQILEPVVVDVEQVLSGMHSMMRRLLGEDIELTLRSAYEGEAPPRSGSLRVLADRGQLEQVIMNLAVNARDAMPRGGNLTLEIARVRCDGSVPPEERTSTHPELAPGEYVKLTVTDTGMGMDAATQALIFEPFFTTKDRGKGTGLGLSTVFGIVQQSGGHITVESEPGQGSCFSVYLPVTERQASEPPKSVAATELRGSETILLVEDDEQLRGVAREILRGSGYSVLEGANGGEALASAHAFKFHIHLLLTDVVMPMMSGRRLADELAPGRSSMKVLFTSGYTDDAVVKHGVHTSSSSFLRKPFSRSVLLRKVREVLDAERGRDGAR